jgi:hypothetical protein
MAVMEIPFSPPVSPDMFPVFAVALIALGLAATAGFFVYQMKAKNSQSHSIGIEIVLGFVASVLLGFGCLFLMLMFGLFV